MKRKKAVALVEKALAMTWADFNPETDRVSVEMWDSSGSFFERHKLVGLRVCEVDFWRDRGGGTGGGSSFMQVEVPEGLAVCAATERAIISLLEEWPAQEQYEEIARLAVAVNGDWAKAAEIAASVIPKGVPA